jgi:hypothetical protein
MTNTTKYIPYGLVILAILAAVYLFRAPVTGVLGSAPAGLEGTVATSSLLNVSSTAITLIATTSCSARIITTTASPIMLTFSDYNGQTPTFQLGHLQAASTTVVYDSGQWGCGLVKAYAFNTGTITFTSVR